MKQISQQIQSIEELEQTRLELHKKHKRVFPFFIMTPIVVFISFLMGSGIPSISFFLGALTTLITFLAYHFSFGTTFNELSSSVKALLLAKFMELYHPSIEYRYTDKRKAVKRIVQNSRLISADQYREEDVLEGKMKDVSFYISEIDLRRQGKNSNHSIFKGILFKIKIPGKSFPNSQIQSKPNLLNRIFNKFTKHEEFDFWFASENNALLGELEPIFPFIRHLIKHQGDIRIATKGEEITLLLESDIKFLDDPKPSINQSFLNNEYHTKIGKQLNSLLFIVEALSNDLSSSQIEEQLVLKEREALMREKVLRTEQWEVRK